MKSKDLGPLSCILHSAETKCATLENLKLTNISQDVSKNRLHALRFTCSFTAIFVKAEWKKKCFKQPLILNHSFKAAISLFKSATNHVRLMS